jgi:multiple sugar transport system permease protein
MTTAIITARSAVAVVAGSRSACGSCIALAPFIQRNLSLCRRTYQSPASGQKSFGWYERQVAQADLPAASHSMPRSCANLRLFLLPDLLDDPLQSPRSPATAVSRHILGVLAARSKSSYRSLLGAHELSRPIFVNSTLMAMATIAVATTLSAFIAYGATRLTVSR